MKKLVEQLYASGEYRAHECESWVLLKQVQLEDYRKECDEMGIEWDFK